MPLKPLVALVVFLGTATGQRMYSTGQIEPEYTTPQQAAEAEAHLRAHPEDVVVVRRLLNYYVARWQTTRPDRLRVILWTIANHPGIGLDAPHDPRGLLLNPDDRSDYQTARQRWLEQVQRYPGDSRVLENAATCLQLSDRQAAVDWLKRALQLNSERRGGLTALLADVYAAAITGVSGMNPWQGPTSVDRTETESAFAQRARTEARADAELAA